MKPAAATPHELPAGSLSDLRVLKISVIDWALNPENHSGVREDIRSTGACTARWDRVVYSPLSRGHQRTYVGNNLEVVPTRSRGKAFFPRDALRLATELHRERRYHLVEGSDPMAGGWVAWRMRRRFGLPLIIQYHTDYFSSLAWLRESPRYLLDTVLAAFLLRRADAVHAVSRAAARDAVRMGAAADRIMLVPPLVHDHEFGAAGAPPDRYTRRRVVFVGRMAPEKNVPVLLEAVRRLRADGVSLHVDLAGSGALLGRFEALSRRLGVGDAVTFLGQQTLEQLAALYRGGSFLVLPSSREALGKVVVEAGLCGLPAIGSRIGGIPEVIDDGVNGWLVTPGDAGDLAAAIRRGLENPALLEQMGQASRERFTRDFQYDRLIETAVQAVWATYARAMGLQGRGGFSPEAGA
jgi:glycosyltransferase involved in cell wall biosynthesis